jgi:hypothetical protein
MDRLMTTAEVGAVLNLKPEKVIALFSYGLRAAKVGNIWRVRESDLRAFSANLRAAVLETVPDFLNERRAVREAAADV